MLKILAILFVGVFIGAGATFSFNQFNSTGPAADLHKSSNSEPHLGDIAPNFNASTTIGHFDFHNWMGDQWTVLFSHPKAFTPVCSTELGVLALFKQEFAKRNTKIIALSVDSVSAQQQWIRQINSTQMAQIDFPLIADPERKIASLYGMVDENSTDEFTIRSVFIIDPEKKVRLKITYPATTGRSFGEILRVLDSLQLADEKKVTTPANWVQGEKVVIPPDMTEDKASTLFSSVEKILPYLRLGMIKDQTQE